MDENWPTLPSATINCPTVSKTAPIGRISQASPNERPRPARTANRPPRYRDSSFETHFQPVPRRHCRKIQKQKSTGHNNINVGGYQDLGRGENNQKVTPTGNENARQKQYFRLTTNRHQRFITNLHPDPTNGLLATSQSLENNRCSYPREDKGRIKSATLPCPLMNAKDVESSIKTLSTHQKRSRTVHLQFKSTARSRVSTDYLSATPRGNEAAEIVISEPPAARPSCHRARASSADARLIFTTATSRNRRAATISTDRVKADVSSNKSTHSISVSVDREMPTADNSSSEISVHSEPYKFHLQRQDPRINTADVQTSLKSANSAIKCRVTDDASTEKINIAETTASAKTCENRVHKHQFRRRK